MGSAREGTAELELCADVIVSAAARRSISVGGGGAPPVQKNRQMTNASGQFVRPAKNDGSIDCGVSELQHENKY